MKYRRGQAALEFLSTYGFAFLIILVMVGALTYFGVLNPSGLVPNKCNAGNGFRCTEVRAERVSATSVIFTVALANDRGKSTSLSWPTSAGSTEMTVPGYGNGLGVAAATPPACAPPGVITNCLGFTTTAPAPGAVAAAPNALAGVAAGSTFYIHGEYSPGANFPGVGEKVRAGITFAYLDAGSAFAQPQSIDITQTLS